MRSGTVIYIINFPYSWPLTHMSTLYEEWATTSDYYPAAESNDQPRGNSYAPPNQRPFSYLSGNVVNYLLHSSDSTPPRPWNCASPIGLWWWWQAPLHTCINQFFLDNLRNSPAWFPEDLVNRRWSLSSMISPFNGSQPFSGCFSPLGFRNVHLRPIWVGHRSRWDPEPYTTSITCPHPVPGKTVDLT